MARDAVRGRVVLFGGDGAGPQGDTWIWDGTAWVDSTPTGESPEARQNHAMVRDARRSQVVLFGGDDNGLSAGGLRNDTWTWDGSSWTEVTPEAGSPAPRQNHALAYDPARGRVILFGGRDARGDRLRDTWEWDGASWTETFPVTDPPVERHSHAMSYGYPRGVALWDGSASAGAQPLNTWQFRYESPGQPAEACRSPIVDHDGDGLLGCDDPDCWGHCTPLCPPGTSCPADAPRCGDGTCNASLESCRLCPGDCGPCPEVCGDFVCDPGEDETSCPGDCATAAGVAAVGSDEESLTCLLPD